MEAETDPELQDHRRGTTDSEQTFLWLLTRIKRAGTSLDTTCSSAQSLMELVGKSVRRLAEWCGQQTAETAAKLNFLLTDGKSLVASHWNDTLYWVEREGIHDCEICGVSHTRSEATPDYRAVVLASEPISREAWQELPDRHVLVVTEGLEVMKQPL